MTDTKQPESAGRGDYPAKLRITELLRDEEWHDLTVSEQDKRRRDAANTIEACFEANDLLLKSRALSALPAAGLPEEPPHSVMPDTDGLWVCDSFKEYADTLRALATRLQGEVERLNQHAVEVYKENRKRFLALERRAEADKADAGRWRYVLGNGDGFYSRFGELYDLWDGENGVDGFNASVDAAKDSHEQS